MLANQEAFFSVEQRLDWTVLKQKNKSVVEKNANHKLDQKRIRAVRVVKYCASASLSFVSVEVTRSHTTVMWDTVAVL